MGQAFWPKSSRKRIGVYTPTGAVLAAWLRMPGRSGRVGMELWPTGAGSSGEAQAAGRRLGAFLVLAACLGGILVSVSQMGGGKLRAALQLGGCGMGGGGHLGLWLAVAIYTCY